MDPESGADVEVFGKYRLLAKLATGGMAEIFLAVQQGLHGFEKVVVIKRVLPDLAENQEFVQMFLDEARLAARLDHTNIVRIYDFGEIEGQYYLAMEYLPGEDLASLLQQAKKNSAKIPIEIAADLVIGAAEGLHFAHELEDGHGKSLSIVHRDISPSNIIATYQGIVKLVDFGIARAESNTTKTSPGGVIKGKFQYLAPEQIRGKPLDRRADLFSLGIVLHELLTGKRLFKRDNELATLNAIDNEEIPPPSRLRPEVPAELDQIVMKMLEREPVGRHQTATELAAELSIFLVHRSYARGTKLLDFMVTMFGDERRKKKIRIAQGGGDRRLARGQREEEAADGVWDVRAGALSLQLPQPEAPQGNSHPPGAGGPVPFRRPPVPRVPPRVSGVSKPAPAPRGGKAQSVVLTLSILGGLGVGFVGFFMAMRAPNPKAEPRVAEAPPSPDEKPREERAPPGLKVGGLKLNGVPTGARVLLDDAAVAKPGGELFVAPGKHRVQVDVKGFMPFEATLDLAVGDMKTVDVVMKPRKVEPKGTVEINCQPWCQITVDGRDTGQTSPVELTLTAGSHALVLANPPLGLAKRLTLTVPENGKLHKIVKLDE